MFLVLLLPIYLTCRFDVLAQTTNYRLQGRVYDERGAAIVGARVELFNSSNVTSTTTAADGSFIFNQAADGEQLRISAAGFAEFSRTLVSGGTTLTVDIQLLPASLRERVTVTATKIDTPLSSTAASVRLLSTADLSTTAALTIDDALRQVPGFQLFRRSGSRTANPTSQGVSLRGVGASGASRALVLADGIPFADPFGGWIYWDRLPHTAVSQIEVVRGGISDLYGSNALGGAINIRTRPSAEPTIRIESSYGNQHTPEASVFASLGAKRLTTSVAGEIFQTKGYVNVRESDRGAIDRPVTSLHRSLYLELVYRANEKLKFFLRPSYFVERRNNGTSLQTNRTHIREVDIGGDWNSGRTGNVSVRSYLSRQTYEQTFSAITANRNSETLTRVQRVPAQAAGLMLQAARQFDKHSLVGGFEAREVRGASDEVAYDRGHPSSLVDAGGRQRSFGLFLRNGFKFNSKVSLAGGTRVDFFSNFKGLNVSRSISPGSPQTTTQLSDSSDFSVSPHVSVLYTPNENLQVFGSVHRAFREPTLNELYRSFRLGNVLTLANENLRRERSSGIEAGVRLSLWRERFDLQTSLFSATITDPIANVTQTNSPALIIRQRQNLGRTNSRGIEVDTGLRLGPSWMVSAGYLLSDSRVISFSANTTLQGLIIPQTPRHSFTFQTSYQSAKHYKFGLQGRVSGSQFEDDQNVLRLRGFFTLDAYVSRCFDNHLELFLASENLLNSRYEVGRTPVTILGAPALLRVGLKARY